MPSGASLSFWFSFLEDHLGRGSCSRIVLDNPKGRGYLKISHEQRQSIVIWYRSIDVLIFAVHHARVRISVHLSNCRISVLCCVVMWLGGLNVLLLMRYGINAEAVPMWWHAEAVLYACFCLPVLYCKGILYSTTEFSNVTSRNNIAYSEWYPNVCTGTWFPYRIIR